MARMFQSHADYSHIHSYPSYVLLYTQDSQLWEDKKRLMINPMKQYHEREKLDKHLCTWLSCAYVGFLGFVGV